MVDSASGFAGQPRESRPMPAHQQFDVIATLMLLSLLAAAVWSDLRENRIPNWVSGGILLLGLALYVAQDGAAGIVSALSGAGIGLVLFLPLYARGAMGAGDVKLMAAAGAWLGPLGALFGCAASLVAGLLFAVVALLSRSALLQASMPGLRAIPVERNRQILLPYALPIFLGVVITGWTLGRLTEFTRLAF
jgi:prepilin peptidase CpaA